jgi:hypothetical protein
VNRLDAAERQSVSVDITLIGACRRVPVVRAGERCRCCARRRSRGLYRALVRGTRGSDYQRNEKRVARSHQRIVPTPTTDVHHSERQLWRAQIVSIPSTKDPGCALARLTCPRRMRERHERTHPQTSTCHEHAPCRIEDLTRRSCPSQRHFALSQAQRNNSRPKQARGDHPNH